MRIKYANAELNRPPKETKCMDILWTGGVGDVMAVDSFLHSDFKKNVKRMFFATRAAKPLMEMFRAVRNECYPNLMEQREIWNDFTYFYAFANMSQLLRKLPPQDKAALNGSTDMSISVKFPEFKRTLPLGFRDSSFIKTKLADITRLNLPERFIFCHADTTNDGINKRFLDNNDWQKVIAFSVQRNQPIVVIGNDQHDKVFGTKKAHHPIPEHKNIINLMNQTNILESIEVLKKSSFYIGIDSCFSVLAAKIFPPAAMWVKACNHSFTYAPIYFAPATTFDFLKRGVL